MDIYGNIFDVQRFSIHDGPGIRTTVFFKGCNLRCLWCHNPESQSAEPQLMYYAGKCTGCGACVAICDKTHTAACTGCGECVKVCRHGAREISGRTVGAAEALAAIERDRIYCETSGGGATLSGGEPLLQPEFAYAILTGCKDRGINTAVETAGCVKWEVIEKLLPAVDLWLFDLKGADDNRHKKNTGVSNRLILENAEKLKRRGADIRFRMPYIPGYNDDELPQVRQIAEGYPLEIMAYHDIGKSKYAASGREYSCAGVVPPDKTELALIAEKNNAEFNPAL